jgi:geranylgeranyl pyrophosphate synthase
LGKLEQKWRLISKELTQVEAGLKQVILTGGPEINAVGDYIFNGTGKRIRPALFLTAAYSPRHSLSALLDAAIAFELMHTASLLHDDVIDQAAIRRGKDAAHVKWSNTISVLSGDYLLSQAFQILVKYENWPLMNLVVEMVQNMAEGEIEQAFADIESPGLEDRYFRWIGKKSAAFFAGCCRAGSLLGGGNREEQDLWAEFGFNLGIAFQLIDDLLDYTGEGKVTGKPLYGDLNNRVITLPLIRTIGTSREDITFNRVLYDESVPGNLLCEAAQAVLDGDGPAYTYLKAEEYARLAAAVIRKLLPAGDEKRLLLEELTEDVLQRSK